VRGMKQYKASVCQRSPEPVFPHLLLIQGNGTGESAGSAWWAREGAAFSAAASFAQAAGVALACAASISAPTCTQHRIGSGQRCNLTPPLRAANAQSAVPAAAASKRRILRRL
jgi:hypothetical protein